MINLALDVWILFVASFLAATFVPAQSEMVLAAMYLTGNHNAALLVMVATFGNVLGACVNWWVGRCLSQLKNPRWFSIREAQLERAKYAYQRFGVWTLLLAWVPLVGDPLTVIAGMFKTPMWQFISLVTIGKAARYIAIVALL